MLNLVLIHVLIAIFSVGYTGYTYLKPSTTSLRLASALVVLTLATGSYLIWLMPSHMVTACITGLAYTVIVMVGIISARHKLSVAQVARSID